MRSLGDDLDLIKDHLEPAALRAGQVLHQPGDQLEQVHFLTSGLASAFAVFKAGEQIECLLVGRTGALGALAAIGFSRAVALTVCHFDSHAWRIPAERMRAAVRQSPVIAQALWNCSQAHIGYGLRVGACNGLHTLEQRLARWLLCASQLLETAEVRLPQDVLADVLGAQRSSINPLLQRFQRAGIISVSRSKLEILDRDGMQRRACECYTALARGMRGPSEEASAF